MNVVFARNKNGAEPDYLHGAALEIFPPSAHFETSTETDAQGRFRFATVPAGKEYLVRIYSGKLVPAKNRCLVRVKPGENAEAPPFVFLHTDETLSGIVVDPQGKPVAGATVDAWTGPNAIYDDIIESARTKPTGADGRFTMTGLPKIPVVLHVGFMVPDGAGEPHYQGPAAEMRVEPGQKDIRIEVNPMPAAKKRTSPRS